jgi:hypothetical protein
MMAVFKGLGITGFFCKPACCQQALLALHLYRCHSDALEVLGFATATTLQRMQ